MKFLFLLIAFAAFGVQAQSVPPSLPPALMERLEQQNYEQQLLEIRQRRLVEPASVDEIGVDVIVIYRMDTPMMQMTRQRLIEQYPAIAKSFRLLEREDILDLFREPPK